MFEPGDPVEKHGGAYGGPGKVVGKFEAAPGVWRYVVAHKIEGGWGVFLHIYSAAQIRHRGIFRQPDNV